MALGCCLLTLKRVALGRIVIVSASQDPHLQSSNQTPQVAVIHVKPELGHESNRAAQQASSVLLSSSLTLSSLDRVSVPEKVEARFTGHVL